MEVQNCHCIPIIILAQAHPTMLAIYLVILHGKDKSFNYLKI